MIPVLGFARLEKKDRIAYADGCFKPIRRSGFRKISDAPEFSRIPLQGIKRLFVPSTNSLVVRQRQEGIAVACLPPKTRLYSEYACHARRSAQRPSVRAY
jgi:hypothetical protein